MLNKNSHTIHPHLPSITYDSLLLRLGALLLLLLDLDPLLPLLFRTGIAPLLRLRLSSLTLSFPLPFPFRAGDRERDTLDVYLRRLGGGERDTESDRLRARRFGGGERESEAEDVRARRFGAGEREREDETERLDLSVRGAGDRDRERDAELYDALRLRDGSGERV
jgi:hypothetical protein